MKNNRFLLTIVSVVMLGIILLSACAQEAPSPFYEARIRMVMANNAATEGEWERAEREFDLAATIQTEINSPLELGRTLFYRGQMRLERGENNFAQADLKRAQGLFKDCGAGFWVEKTLAADRS